MGKIIALTGASGSMGKETLRSLLSSPQVDIVRILLLDTAKDRRFIRKYRHEKKVEWFFGNIQNKEDCKRLVKGSDYVLHLAALIPPRSDHDEEETRKTNYDGTVHLVEATAEEGKIGKEPAFIYISSVAIYGDRNVFHPWGRVGDPVLPSVFDVYATSKARAERYVMESPLKRWAVLRQTGILYDNLMLNNIRDGLLFHTPWNVPIEWVTARDSGNLMKKIVEKDGGDNFWKQIFNIGGGKTCRQTGYQTFSDGFSLIGGSPKTFFHPEWNMVRNFHCFWFSDSDVLEEMFGYRSQGIQDFWEEFSSRHRIYQAARALPPALIRKLVIVPLLKNENAPTYWKEKGDTARMLACFGSQENSEKKNWEDFSVLCEREEYPFLLQTVTKLSHGYDENKKDLTIKDMQEVARFRGGECLSEEMGDMYTPLRWKCAEGHVFTASPFIVVKGGYWCPVCCMPDKEWKTDILAKEVPFYHQVWIDSHAESENYIYRQENQKAFVREEV